MGKRGHGEGSITKRADGRWYARADLGYVHGKRKWKHIYGKTRKEVAEKLNAVLAQQQQGVNIAPERQTVEQYLTQWLADVVVLKDSYSTHKRYELAVRRHIVPYIGRVPLAKLTPEHVQQMFIALRDMGLAANTIQRTRDILRNALNVALRRQLVSRNVATLADPPRVPRYQPRILTREQAHLLLQTARGHRLETLYRVALSLGLREGEILGLRWQDVNLEAGSVHVAVALKLINGQLVLDELKTERSKRTLPLSPSFVTALRNHKVRQLEERMLMGSRWNEHGLVYPSTVGTPMSPSNLLRSFHGLLKRAGLPLMRFHDLRHSCATFLAASGVPQRIAMEILGHTNIATTTEIYTHVLEESKRDALLNVDRLFDVG